MRKALPGKKFQLLIIGRVSGSVESGQSMLRPVRTASWLVFQRARVHTAAKLPDV
jgi:hypothetical protein